jgi:hypothetical protein
LGSWATLGVAGFWCAQPHGYAISRIRGEPRLLHNHRYQGIALEPGKCKRRLPMAAATSGQAPMRRSATRSTRLVVRNDTGHETAIYRRSAYPPACRRGRDGLRQREPWRGCMTISCWWLPRLRWARLASGGSVTSRSPWLGGRSVGAHMPRYRPAAAVPAWHYPAPRLDGIACASPACSHKGAGRSHESNARQWTLNPRVRGSSPSGAPVLTWGFTPSMRPREGRFRAVIAH